MDVPALLRELEMDVQTDEDFERGAALLERVLPELPPGPDHPLRFPAMGLLGRLMDYACGEPRWEPQPEPPSS